MSKHTVVCERNKIFFVSCARGCGYDDPVDTPRCLPDRFFVRFQYSNRKRKLCWFWNKFNLKLDVCLVVTPGQTHTDAFENVNISSKNKPLETKLENCC